MVDPQRLKDELRRLKQLINRDPRVLARFDKDGNGVIDGEEWEEVRQLVIRRLERQEAETKSAPAPAPGSASPGGAPPEPEETVAGQLFAQDLTPLPPEPHSAASAAQHSVLIVEQQGGLGQVFEGVVRRNYHVYSADGRTLAKISQVESEITQNFTQKGWSVPDLHFRVSDQVSGEQFLFQKSESMGQGTRVAVLNGQGGEIAHAHFRGRLLEREVMAYSSLVAHGLKVTRRMLRPWTHDIKTELDDKVGSIERGWSGLGGFLSGGNKMRIEVESGRAPPEIMWALVATSLLFDLSVEDKEGGGLRIGL